MRLRSIRLKHPLAVVAVTLALGLLWIAVSELREAHEFSFEKIAIPGVPNAGRVTGRLYRGGQPSDEGLKALKREGVDTIVSFTLDTEGGREEARQAESIGLHFVHLPWSATGAPPREYIDRFLAIASDASSVVFAHCKAGSDRTGLMIAAYRVRVDRWTADDALEEMDAFGYEVEFHPQLRRALQLLAAHD